MQDAIFSVNLSSIRDNADTFLSLTKAKLCAVVKANAYSHGANEVSDCLKGKASFFAVSLVEEGVSLRLAGVREEILVLTPPTDEYDVERASCYDLILSVSDEYTKKLCKGKRVHLKLNTGMNRYGAKYAETLFGDFEIEGLYSHFYSRSSMKLQYRAFMRQAETFKREVPKGILHLSATEGTLADKRYHLDMVRIGIGLYGYASIPLKKAMKVYARCMQNTHTRSGGQGYFPRKGNDLSTLRIGYGDGLLRSNECCMDAFVKTGNHSVGEYVCVMDDAEKIARKNATIPYEVLTSLGRRGRYVYQS